MVIFIVILAPLVRVNDKSVLHVWKSIPTKILVVRMQDLLNKNCSFNKTFYEITEAGGIHKFLGFDSHIVLSSIMRDSMIKTNHKFHGAEKYIETINSIKPDSYTTPDAMTYEMSEWSSERDSWQEIARVIELTKTVLNNCPKSIPIGQIKGCNEFQVDYHVKVLKGLGINSFIFHVGDFSRHGSSRMIRKARFLSSRIRPYTNNLILYGMGSQKRLVEFSFADVFVTYNHFVTAKNAMIYIGTKNVKYNERYSPAIVERNLIQMHKNISLLRHQTKLNMWGVKPWVVDQPQVALATHKIVAEIYR